MKGPIQSVEVSYLVHATEDPEKVRDAVARLLAVGSEPELESLEGHFGNRIVMARLHLTGEEAGMAFRKIVAMMPPALKKDVLAGISSFLDEHSSLFLRLDKQRLVSGHMALGTGDPVRVKVKPRVFLVRGGAPQFFSQVIGGAQNG